MNCDCLSEITKKQQQKLPFLVRKKRFITSTHLVVRTRPLSRTVFARTSSTGKEVREISGLFSESGSGGTWTQRDRHGTSGVYFER